MKFKYNELEVSYKISLDGMEKIRTHASSFIRGINLRNDNSLIYNTIDANLIEFIAENDEELVFLNKNTLDTNSSVVENWEICRGNIFTLTTSTTNASMPGWANIGNNISGLIFADNRNQNISTSFDLGGKYKEGTPIYLDLAYIPMSTSNGKILFKVEYNKGLPNNSNNELIINNDTITYEALNNNVIGEYKRISIELDNSSLASNGMIIVNIGRLGTNNIDTYKGTFALIAASLRYKINNNIAVGEIV